MSTNYYKIPKASEVRVKYLNLVEQINDLTFFNGSDFLIHVPFKYLVDSVIVTSTFEMSLADHMRSKVEALVTK
jgi:hypothetical protein